MAQTKEPGTKPRPVVLLADEHPDHSLFRVQVQRLATQFCISPQRAKLTLKLIQEGCRHG